MLRSIEILGLRAIRYAHVELNGFQVLVGPNASGKSTLLDALTLVRDVLTVGIERALRGDARFDIPQAGRRSARSDLDARGVARRDRAHV